METFSAGTGVGVEQLERITRRARKRMNYGSLSARQWIQMAQIYFNYSPDAPIPVRLVELLRDSLSDKSEEIRLKAAKEIAALAGR